MMYEAEATDKPLKSWKMELSRCLGGQRQSVCSESRLPLDQQLAFAIHCLFHGAVYRLLAHIIVHLREYYEHQPGHSSNDISEAQAHLIAAAQSVIDAWEHNDSQPLQQEKQS